MERISIILQISRIIIVVLIVFCIFFIIYVSKQVRTRNRIDDRFKQFCNEFEGMGMIVRVYRSSYKEERDFLLVKILKGEELIREKEVPVFFVSKREFNLRLTRNEVVANLLRELT